ncbi:MAG: helix-turn-helix domain-containing protein [Dehalococcoidia bacterium]
MASADAMETGREWLSLGQACKILGVNESTLRRWANDGQVRTFRTPGGHRRFAGEDLRRLQQRGPRKEQALPEYQALGSLAVAQIRRRLQRGKSHEPAWQSTVDEEGRLRFRPLGRRLVDLASECLRKRTGRSRLTEEARAIGREYGQELARDGLPLRDAVEAFTFFRRSLGETTRQLAQRENLSAEEASNAWEHVSSLADVVLVSMMEALDGTGRREQLAGDR